MTTLPRTVRRLLPGVALLALAAADATPPAMPAVGGKWKGVFTPAVGPAVAVSGKVTAAGDGKLTLALGGQIGMTADWAFDVAGKLMRLSSLTVTRGSVRVTNAAGRGQWAADQIEITASWYQSKGKVANLPVSGHLVLHPDGPPPRAKPAPKDEPTKDPSIPD